MFIAVVMDTAPTGAAWASALDAVSAYENGVVTFKTVVRSNIPIRTLIAPAHTAAALIDTMVDHSDVDRADIHVFRLSAIIR